MSLIPRILRGKTVRPIPLLPDYSRTHQRSSRPDGCAGWMGHRTLAWRRPVAKRAVAGGSRRDLRLARSHARTGPYDTRSTPRSPTVTSTSRVGRRWRSRSYERGERTHERHVRPRARRAGGRVIEVRGLTMPNASLARHALLFHYTWRTTRATLPRTRARARQLNRAGHEETSTGRRASPRGRASRMLQWSGRYNSARARREASPSSERGRGRGQPCRTQRDGKRR